MKKCFCTIKTKEFYSDWTPFKRKLSSLFFSEVDWIPIRFQGTHLCSSTFMNHDTGKQIRPWSDCQTDLDLHSLNTKYPSSILFLLDMALSPGHNYSKDSFLNSACRVIFLNALCPLQIIFEPFDYWEILNAYLLSADYFKINCFEYHQSVKQIGSRSGPTKHRAWSGSKLFAKVISIRH